MSVRGRVTVRRDLLLGALLGVAAFVVGSVVLSWLVDGDRRVFPALAAVAGAVVIALSFRLSNHAREVSRDVGIALLTGAVLGLVIFPIDEDRSAREERFENLRFVREAVISERARTGDHDPLDDAALEPNEEPYKPFRSLDLQGMSLAGLDLSYADLTDANLRGADLYGANLSHAHLTDADLTGANLFVASLDDAGLTGAILSGADLEKTSLEGARLEGADLETAKNLKAGPLTSGISHNSATKWPPGFVPPPSAGA